MWRVRRHTNALNILYKRKESLLTLIHIYCVYADMETLYKIVLLVTVVYAARLADGFDTDVRQADIRSKV